MDQNIHSSAISLRTVHSLPSWNFRLIHYAAFALTLPIFAIARLWPRHDHGQKKESLFAETNSALLIALGFAMTS